MESKRQQQIARMVQEHLSAVFQTEGPGIYGKAFVTIAGVKVTPDLLVARAYLSVYNVENKQDVVDSIVAHTGLLRKLVGNRMRNRVRKIPELEFFLDETLDDVFRLENLFDDLNKPADDDKS